MFFKILDGKIKHLNTCSHEILFSFRNDAYKLRIIFTIQNVAWPNYYRSLVNIILDNKALYVYKHKNE